ncbi:hypothetical protein DER44DRAFT_833819 [Fusarium oxysporum]|nr:hypothetical protein DER44DRAFT_833819 [Fusarium oxysporum]
MASQAIEAKYRALGGNAGFLGHATTSLTQDIGIDGASGYHIDYNSGSIYWTAAEGAHVIYGQIYQKWISVGGPNFFLGYPKTDEASTQDGQGRFNDFAANGRNTGSIYWTLQYGAILIYGTIWLKWEAFGRETSFLGYPITDEATTPDGQCRFNDFAKAGNTTGAIYWTQRLGAFLIYGQIFQKWKSIGRETSNLGYPITDETSTPDGRCRFNDFAINGNPTGSIYWTSSQGAHLIYGQIWLKWKSIGGEGGHLGYPITDEASTPDGRCRFNDFAKDGNTTGAIYWTRERGAFLIYGQIFQKWKSVGGESGVLGYPVTDELPANDHGGRYNVFSNGGSIYWSPSTGARVISGGLPPELV